jgi:hypothetical protein
MKVMNTETTLKFYRALIALGVENQDGKNRIK